MSKKPNTQERPIILFPEGEARQTVLPSQIEIPDLRQLAKELSGTRKEKVLKTWLLANELRRIIIEQSTTRFRSKEPIRCCAAGTEFIHWRDGKFKLCEIETIHHGPFRQLIREFAAGEPDINYCPFCGQKLSV